jgi:hypothetical protein
MIQQPRWMCYDQQLTVVKQKCKEFDKNTRICKEKQDIKQKIENKYLEFS